MTNKVLVIGGGFGGCIGAHMLSTNGWDVTLVEAAPFLGGGCKTLHYGGHPFTYGPRHFLTQDEKLFNFLHQYTPMRKIPEHEFLTYVERDNAFYQYPIHMDDVERMPDSEQILREMKERKGVEDAKNLEDYWIGSVGPTLYRKFVEGYSKKMWKVDSNTELDDFAWSPKGVAIKTGPRAAWTGAISAFPIKQNGYDDYFDIATAKTKVLLNTMIEDFDIPNKRVKLLGKWRTYDIIINTISPEIMMKNAFGPLRWIGRDFLKIVLPMKECFPKDTYFLYYANQEAEEPHTRIVEYKKFYRNESPTTLLVVEIPSLSNKLYPSPLKKHQAEAKKYFDAYPDNVFSMGRAACFKYIDVDDIIQQGFDLLEKVGSAAGSPAAKIPGA